MEVEICLLNRVKTNYRINGRQETLTLGTYGIGGLTLSQAREMQLEARALVQKGEAQHGNMTREVEGGRALAMAAPASAWLEG